MGEKGGSILATTNNEIIEVLKTIAPGTPIREGLENILKAKTGGLIVIGDGKEVMDIADGGFRLDVEYTPARLSLPTPAFPLLWKTVFLRMSASRLKERPFP